MTATFMRPCLLRTSMMRQVGLRNEARHALQEMHGSPGSALGSETGGVTIAKHCPDTEPIAKASALLATICCCGP